jgi:hypothetical protein
MPAGVRDLLGAFVAVLLRAGGIVAAAAPSRWWPALDEHLPVTTSAALSGILTFFAGAMLGISGFLDYGTRLAEQNVAVFLKMAARPEAEGVLTSSALSGMNGLAFFTFLFFTPMGWATLYLGGTGALRALASAFSDGMGDPLLTAIDAVTLDTVHRTKARARRSRREALEGPELPDRVVSGRSVGVPTAELVIISSRVKEGWDRGTVVISGEKCYRVGTIEERTIGGRLRTLYPLTEHRDLEAFRRSVYYEIPTIQRR